MWEKDLSGVGGAKALKRFFTKKSDFFFILIIFPAVDDISAFYLPPFFMSFTMFLVRFARQKKKNTKKRHKNPGSKNEKTVDSVGAFGFNQSVQKQ